ncbi:DUF305 domain-containing protein [Cryobacterium zhongshanensis]|uniref:DUF305 domain-containing protein n=1 Tax=Cryobacterium zhongshanensis TaxID=2928153 RepID=A0AA41UGU4_9MICO|nr:DUF305 domain-containing protein [Cryobacterium zhongshanensis]MCI4660158.1 DUF305 domain-containing protein [Cryobacterium zhongshanensis]
MISLRIPLLAATALAAAIALSACSAGATTAGGANASASSAPAASTAAFNDADVSFAMPMVDHHQQAITMAQAMLDKTGVDPRVTALAEQIKAAQGPEITMMSSWVTAWGATATNMPGMDMSSGSMTDGDMAALDAATGPAADKLFLEQMIQHHQGAIDMANVELKDGQNPDAQALATKIIADQTAQIKQMQDILATL